MLSPIIHPRNHSPCASGCGSFQSSGITILASTPAYSFSRFKGCLAVPTGCHQYPFRCTFVLYRVKEVTNGTYTNSVLVPFGLNDHFLTKNRTGIEGNTVHPTITRCLSESRFQAHLLEQICNQRLELRGSKIHEIGTLI